MSFICSQNNNIKRIFSLVKTLRQTYGSKINCTSEHAEDQFAFPTLAQMKKATDAELRALGFGYRAPYIIKSLDMIEEKGGEEFLLGLRQESLEKCREELTELHGVGNKVADCIALFSLDQASCVPVDTHVFQIAKKFKFISGSTTLTASTYQQINEAFVKKYGDKAGWAH